MVRRVPDIKTDATVGAQPKFRNPEECGFRLHRIHDHTANLREPKRVGVVAVRNLNGKHGIEASLQISPDLITTGICNQEGREFGDLRQGMLPCTRELAQGGIEGMGCSNIEAISARQQAHRSRRFMDVTPEPKILQDRSRKSTMSVHYGTRKRMQGPLWDAKTWRKATMGGPQQVEGGCGK